jgi:large subunit ribosomal protein L19
VNHERFAPLVSDQSLLIVFLVFGVFQMAATKQKHRRTNKGTLVPTKGLADKVALVEKGVIRNDLPEFNPGDTVRVHVRIKEGEKERLQAYEGVVIAKGNRGASKSFTVRKISSGIGVERVFMENSPKVGRLEVVSQGKVRRAKLYYLRGLAGKAAKLERDVEGMASTAAAAKETAKSKEPAKK